MPASGVRETDGRPTCSRLASTTWPSIRAPPPGDDRLATYSSTSAASATGAVNEHVPVVSYRPLACVSASPGHTYLPNQSQFCCIRARLAFGLSMPWPKPRKIISSTGTFWSCRP